MSSPISKAIQDLYDSPLEVSELQEAERVLIEFFELLIEIDRQNKKEIKGRSK